LTLTAVELRANVNYEPYTFTSFVGSVQGYADGTGSAAKFFSPSGIAADSTGNIYVADFNNNAIRKITPAGVVTTLAGHPGTSGSADGTGNAAQFYSPTAVVPDTNGNVYVADTYNATIRKVTPAGVVTTIAGQAGNWNWADGNGANALFAMPRGLTIDASGNLYVADGINRVIRKITPAHDITTFAGSPGVQGSADGNGPSASFTGLFGLAIDTAGNIYAADYDNNNIRKITPARHVTTIAGLAGSPGTADGIGLAATFYAPWAVATDSSNNVYVTDGFNSTIRKITQAGVVTTLAGIPGVSGSANGSGNSATFSWPQGIATDSSGSLYVADFNNETIRKGYAHCPTIALSPATLPGGTPAGAYSQAITASGGAAAYTYSLTAGSLPTGLHLSAGGTISGTPALGTYNFTITATDTNGCSGSANYSIAVTCPTISLSPATLSDTTPAPYSRNITANGGAGPYIYSLTGGSLPTGLTLSAGGAISGRPALGTYNFTITATDTNGCSGSASYSIAVTCPSISLSPATLSDTTPAPYSHNITANGGAAPYFYALTGGSLPTGLQLSSGGAISGTPALGTYNFTITATDTNGCSGSANYGINVKCPTISLNPATLLAGTLGAAYNQSVTAIGAIGSCSYSVTSGSLPNGMTLTPNGTLAGVPIGLSTNTFTVTATDANGCTGSTIYTLIIGPSGNPLDTTSPILTIRSTLTNALIFSNSPIATIAGTARDPGPVKSGLALVLYSLNGAAQQQATMTTVSNWTANITLVPGWNTLAVQALDYRGNASVPTNLAFYYGATTNVTGTYKGFFCQTNGSGALAVNIQSAGTLTASVTMQRVYTGSLYINGTNCPIKGTFDLAGNSTLTISRAGLSKPNLAVNLHLDWTGVTKQMTGTVSCPGEGWTSPLAAIWTFKAK